MIIIIIITIIITDNKFLDKKTDGMPETTENKCRYN